MEIIVSLRNRRVLECRRLRQKKHRTQTGSYAAEGLRLAEEAVQSGLAEVLFVNESFGSAPRERRLLEWAAAAGCEQLKTDARVFACLAQTQSPQGVIAITRKPRRRLDDLETGAGAVLLILDGIQDPGNLGTIIRTAWAAGVRGVLCLPDTADPYEGKCVRASMGGIFHVPVFTDVTWAMAEAYCLDRGFGLAMADAAASLLYNEVSWPSKTALCIGNEARGFWQIPREAAALHMRIPLSAGAESLNAAVACGILLYEIQRRVSG
jgi:TrmH family RNA methyltransferase